MKIIALFLLLSTIAMPVMACIETDADKEARLKAYDLNGDGYVDASEWNKLEPNRNFEDTLRFRDKDGDGKFSKEEFETIGFVKSMDGM